MAILGHMPAPLARKMGCGDGFCAWNHRASHQERGRLAPLLRPESLLAPWGPGREVIGSTGIRAELAGARMPVPLRHRLPAPSLSRLLSFPRAFSKTSRGISCSSLRPRMGPRPVSPWRSTRRWAGGWDCQETVRRGPGGGSSEGTCLLSWPPLPRPVRMAVEPSCCQWPAEKCPRESTSVSGLGSPPPQVPAGGSGCSCPPPPHPASSAAPAPACARSPSAPLRARGHHVRCPLRLHPEPHSQGEQRRGGGRSVGPLGPFPGDWGGQERQEGPLCPLLAGRHGWNTCGTSSRSERTTFSPSTPCATRPSVWGGPSGARRTTASWSSLIR